MKFGGGCLKTADDFIRIADILRKEKKKTCVVLSAIYGITDLLEKGITEALVSEESISQTINDIRQIQNRIIVQAFKDTVNQDAIKKELEQRYKRLKRLLKGISYLKEVTDATRALILSFGERFSIIILTALLLELEIKAEALEADKIGIITNQCSINASVNLSKTKQNIAINVIPLLERGIFPIITGFFGCSESGKVALLGRNGSDYSAAILARCLEVKELIIWKNVEGFLSADPTIISEAFKIPKLSYYEAAELSYFGAKILHPRTVEPFTDTTISIIIKSFKDPEDLGTIITPKNSHGNKLHIKGVSFNCQIAILKIQGSGIGYKPGIIGIIGNRLAKSGINIYSVITSQTCINLLVHTRDAERSYKLLEQMIGDVIEKIILLEDRALVGVVGEGILQTNGLAAQVFTAVAREEINIEMISAGASDVAYYFIVKQENVLQAVEAVHNELFPQTDRSTFLALQKL
jgi:aspartate kinase